MSEIWEFMERYADFLAAFVAPVTACIVAYVAWQQHRLRAFDTRLKLYDRRYKVFEITVQHLASVVRKAQCSSVEADELVRNTSAAGSRHLFGDEVAKFIREIRDHSLRVARYGASGRNKDNEEQIQWHGDAIPRAEKLFAPYLDLQGA